MAFDDFGGAAFLSLDFYRGHEKVVKETPLGFVEIVEEIDD